MAMLQSGTTEHRTPRTDTASSDEPTCSDAQPKMPTSNSSSSSEPRERSATLATTASRPLYTRTRSQSQHSLVARAAIMTNTSRAQNNTNITPRSNLDGTAASETLVVPLKAQPAAARLLHDGIALNDTPAPTAPNSPNIPPKRQNSYDKIRQRPTTLDIPGLTKSKVSPDGRISQRDVGSKLVIVMVGLPARGKSYITKKMARYLNWLQHDTRIFNVGERRRIAASGRASSAGLSPTGEPLRLLAANSRRSREVTDIFRAHSVSTAISNGIVDQHIALPSTTIAARVLLNGGSAIDESSPEGDIGNGKPRNTDVPELHLPEPSTETPEEKQDVMDQSASFFDPANRRAALLREQVALETLDELLNYILDEGGSVGILDATNSTLERRKLIVKHIKQREPSLNVLFLESMCVDENLLERNMRLKLSGPDYQGKDPEASLADFKQRVAIYEKAYVPLGEYEEQNNMSFVQMVDVGRKVISHQVKGFLSAQAVYYLLNFNLAPRQIWITRHGQSADNISGKIGGDSELSSAGHQYAKDLARFISHERQLWEVKELDKERKAHLPPQRGDTTPPNPHYADAEDHILSKNFCVWTSMLKRSIQTAEFFDEEDYEIKQMRMLNELFAGHMEGMTYEEIRATHGDEFERRRIDKLHYRYPGPGGEGYLDVINRLRPVIHELERMTDHCLLIGHRSVVRILLAYFKGLGRDEVTDLNVPIGMLYCLEPRPYGVDLRCFRYNPDKQWFEFEPDWQLKKATSFGEAMLD